MDKRLIIAIDGPVGSGKSTVAKRLAERLGYLYVDTGAMYRAVAWKALQLGVSLEDAEALTRLAEQSRIVFEGEAEDRRILLDGQDVTAEIRSPEVSHAASIISTIGGVRRALVAEQQRIGRQGSVVVEGRNIGKVVFPDAEVKFFLDASVEVRAKRRFEEERAKGSSVTLEEVLRQTMERDRRDTERATSPLRPAEDAIYIDSSDLSVDEVVERMIELIKQTTSANRCRTGRV